MNRQPPSTVDVDGQEEPQQQQFRHGLPEKQVEILSNFNPSRHPVLDDKWRHHPSLVVTRVNCDCAVSIPCTRTSKLRPDCGRGCAEENFSTQTRLQFTTARSSFRRSLLPHGRMVVAASKSVSLRPLQDTQSGLVVRGRISK